MTRYQKVYLLIAYRWYHKIGERKRILRENCPIEAQDQDFAPNN
jgi:hypothetical protein